MDKDKLQNVSGELFLPKEFKGKVPAMIVVHGTGGIDNRTKYFADNLPKFGIAVFMVDFKTGVFTSPKDRLPGDDFQPFAFAALKTLRQNSNIDQNKIGIMGFSLGGNITLTSALMEYKSKWLGETQNGFKVHVAYYPGCKFFLRKIKSNSQIQAPLKVYWGTKDSYGDGEYCPKLKNELSEISKNPVELESFEGGHHGFDGLKTISYYDPAAINTNGYSEANSDFANKARQSSIEFIIKYLK